MTFSNHLAGPLQDSFPALEWTQTPNKRGEDQIANHPRAVGRYRVFKPRRNAGFVVMFNGKLIIRGVTTLEYGKGLAQDHAEGKIGDV